MSNKTPIQKPSAQVQQADAFWKHVFVEGPYTAFVMIDYLRSKATVNNWNEVLTSGWSNQKGLVAFSQAGDKQEAIMKDADLSRIWAGKTGRCTSFAVKVMSLLEKQSPGTFKFKVYDIGHHRVARCEKTAVLIDSSSKQGAFPLPEGEWVRIEGSSWKWSDGKSKFERVEGSSGVVSCFQQHVNSHIFPLVLLLLETTFPPLSQTLYFRFALCYKCFRADIEIERVENHS